MEVIWTFLATEDFLRAETSRPEEFAAALDGALRLLKVFPEIYYGHAVARICVVALVDLRQDSDTIERIIRERQP